MVAVGCGGREASVPLPALAVELISSELSNPIFVTAPPGDTERLFVVEQTGAIRVIELATKTVRAEPFLDLSDAIEMGHEQGLLGLAFHPRYAENGTFYVNYVAPGGAADNGVTMIRQYQVSAADRNRAELASGKTVLQIDQPQGNHNGGWIGFSPRKGDENNLYIAMGDGGAAFDEGNAHVEPGGNAQSLQSLHGKMLRVQVKAADGTYTIPRDNPHASSNTARKEIWLLGLRNPYRASFDRVTGDLFIADVGQDQREEINLQKASNPAGGENYGWRLREGKIVTPGRVGGARPRGAVDPLFEYGREVGLCVIGGYVYRGSRIPELQGTYVFGDYSGKVYALTFNGKGASRFQELTAVLFPSGSGLDLQSLSSLGEDAEGELYLTSLTGSVFKIVPAARR
ncbi:hypothetical protein BH20VER2_BH20VER2_16920 [soil metagenome]